MTFFIPKIKKNVLYMMPKGNITFRNAFILSNQAFDLTFDSLFPLGKLELEQK